MAGKITECGTTALIKQLLYLINSVNNNNMKKTFMFYLSGSFYYQLGTGMQ